MSRMIATLLDFTRIRIGGGIQFEFKPATLIDLCRNIVAELATVHADAQLRCDSVGDTNGTWDADRLEQAVSNMTANAIQHGAKGSPITIHIDGSGKEWVVVSVHNAGVIDPQKLATLFEPFKGHRRSSHSSGLGLGLYISHEIIRAHGGEVHVRSNEHEGTTFMITLPRHSHPEPPPSP
jgi:signal transduction histidine kinase